MNNKLTRDLDYIYIKLHETIEMTNYTNMQLSQQRNKILELNNHHENVEKNLKVINNFS
jgi:hypothetical protein